MPSFPRVILKQGESYPWSVQWTPGGEPADLSDISIFCTVNAAGVSSDLPITKSANQSTTGKGKFTIGLPREVTNSWPVGLANTDILYVDAATGNHIFTDTFQIDVRQRETPEPSTLIIPGPNTQGQPVGPFDVLDATPVELYVVNIPENARGCLATIIEATALDGSVSGRWTIARDFHFDGETLAAGPSENLRLPTILPASAAVPPWLATVEPRAPHGARVLFSQGGAVNARVRAFVEYIETQGNVPGADAMPGVSSIAPDVGDSSKYTTIAIRGTSLSSTQSVRVGSTEVPFTVVSSKLVTAIVPPLAASVYVVTITNANGLTSFAGGFTSWLIPSGQAAWFRACVGVIQDAGFASQWQDQSGNAHHARQTDQTRQPSVVLSDPLFNNRKALSFATPYTTMSATFSLPQPFTVFAVGRSSGIGGYPHYFFDGASGYSGLAGNGSTGFEMYAGASLLQSANPTNPSLITATFNGTSSVLSVNSQTEVVGNAGTGVAGGITLGGNLSGAYNLGGNLCELMVFGGTLSTPQRNIIRAQMAAYYGITLV